MDNTVCGMCTDGRRVVKGTDHKAVAGEGKLADALVGHGHQFPDLAEEDPPRRKRWGQCVVLYPRIVLVNRPRLPSVFALGTASRFGLWCR